MNLINRRLTLLLYTLPLLFLAGFYFYPLAGILRVSFAQEGGVGQAVWMQPFFWRVLWFTTWQAAASMLLTLLVGMPLAWLFARFDFPGKGLVRALTTIPFVMPTVVVAAAFTSLIGPSGLVNGWLMQAFALDTPPLQLLQTIWVILLAHVFYNVSVVIRTVGSFWANLSPHYEEAAASLGANPAQRFWLITLPLLLPSVTAAGLLVFLFCFTSFGVVLILGGLRFATMEVEIYRQAVTLFNLPAAALLSLVQMGLTFGVMAVYTRVQRRASLSLDQRPTRSTARRRRAPGRRSAPPGATAARTHGVPRPPRAAATRAASGASMRRPSSDARRRYRPARPLLEVARHAVDRRKGVPAPEARLCPSGGASPGRTTAAPLRGGGPASAGRSGSRSWAGTRSTSSRPATSARPVSACSCGTASRATTSTPRSTW